MDISADVLKSEVQAAQKRWGAVIKAAEEKNQLPAGLLYAVGSRETNLNPKYVEGATGDGGHGHGIWQLDNRSHQIPAGFDTDIEAQATVAAEFLAQLSHEFPGNLEAAMCAYNAGAGAVREALGAKRDPNGCTTGHDYGRDVLARYQVVRTMAGV